MAEGQSPEKSPPAPSPPPGSSSSPPPSQDQSSPSPPPPQEEKNQSSPTPPQQDNTQPSPPPPPSENSSSSAPPPPSGNSPSQDTDNNKGNGKNGNKDDDNKSKESNNDKNNNKDFSPPPPPKSSERGTNPSPRSLGPPKSGGGSGSSRDNGLNMDAIIAVAVGGGLLLLVMICLCVCCCRKKKKKRKNPYGNNPYGGAKAGGEYYNGGPQQQYYNQTDHVVSMPPPPGAMGTNWAHSPPPPPPGNWGQNQSPQGPVSGPTAHHNNDMSSSFSGGPRGPSLPPPHPSLVLGFNKSTFTYDELAVATQGFSEANLLGQGGFGYVHKGFLPNGKEVAVKSLKSGSGQGEREFQAEVDIISRVHHRHLVSLVGYCIAGEQRMLVYEFVPNNTLEFHLHGKGRPVMDWPTRLKIALGSAKGLAYLHEDCHPRIIHRDIKCANILLDFNFEAQVADFGLAKLSQDTNTHVSTRIMGTFGYLAPEYASSGKLTEKSDVFSFGVMLLELITGRRPVDPTGEMEDNLVDWARQSLEDHVELVDPRLEKNYDPNELTRMVSCASAAVRHSARRRPKMSQIVRALEGDASMEVLYEGMKPGQSGLWGSSSTAGGSTDYDYGAEMKQFRKVAILHENNNNNSNNYASGDFGGATSEYGLHLSSTSSSSCSHSHGDDSQLPAK